MSRRLLNFSGGSPCLRGFRRRRQSETLITSAERVDEGTHVLVSATPLETFRGLDDPSHRPAQHHVPTAPARDVPMHSAEAADEILDCVRGAQRAPQGVTDVEREYGQCLIETFAETRRRTGIRVVELSCECLQLPARGGGVCTAIRTLQRRPCRALTARGQIAEHVAEFVDLTALHPRGLPQGLLDGFA